MDYETGVRLERMENKLDLLLQEVRPDLFKEDKDETKQTTEPARIDRDMRKVQAEPSLPQAQEEDNVESEGKMFKDLLAGEPEPEDTEPIEEGYEEEQEEPEEDHRPRRQIRRTPPPKPKPTKLKPKGKWVR